MINVSIDGEITASNFDFKVYHFGRSIPATFWRCVAKDDRPSPVVLLHHGGAQHKRHEKATALAEAVVRQTGSSVLMIDGPVHGQRRSDQPETMEMLGIFKRFWKEEGGIDEHIADWRAALDAVIEQGWADSERIVWFGVSMGTAYGIPLCAAEPRIRAAAIGMWGLQWGQETRLLSDAARMRVPVLFHIKSRDELFSTEEQRAIFDAIGSDDKCLHTYAGGHSLTAPEAPTQLDDIFKFLQQALADRKGTAATS